MNNTKTIGELVKIYKGNKADDVFADKRSNAFRYLQIDDLRPNSKKKFTYEIDSFLAIEKDVLIAWDGANAGTVSFGLSGYIGSTLAALRLKSDEYDTAFIGRFLQSKSSFLREQCTGATIPHINRNTLENLSLQIPNPDEQKRIAAILDKADRLRRQRRFAQTLSDSFLQSVFIKMFGDPLKNIQGFKQVPLDEIGEVKGGLQVSSVRDNLPLKKPYLRVANVFRNELNLSEIKFIGLTEAEFKSVQLKKGDILIVEGHGNINEIGRCAIWDGSIENCVHQNHLIRVRANSQHISEIYLARYINFTGRKYFTKSSHTTSGLNTISTGIVKRCPVLLPPLPLQEKIRRNRPKV